MRNKVRLDQKTVDRIRNMDLSERALHFVECTPLNTMHETFGNCQTSEDVEELARDFSEED